MNPIYPDKVRENRARRQAERLGVIVKKSHGKLWNIDNQLGYMIVDGKLNAVLQGEKYNMTIEEVEEWLGDYEKNLRDE